MVVLKKGGGVGSCVREECANVHNRLEEKSTIFSLMKKHHGTKHKKANIYMAKAEATAEKRPWLSDLLDRQCSHMSMTEGHDNIFGLFVAHVPEKKIESEKSKKKSYL